MKALVTGAAGQDGTLLRRLLHSRGAEVLALEPAWPARRDDDTPVRAVDVTDARTLAAVIREFAPDEIYHLAACHHSSEEEGDVALHHRMVATNFGSTETIVTTVAEWLPACRVLYAGSSQMYVSGMGEPVTERTPMSPSTFYGLTKLWSRQLLAFYREHHGVYCSTAILFNHESPLRPPQFLTRKISRAAAQARVNGRCALHLRDISAQVDWSSARDIVAGMQLALSPPEPQDYVLASGVAHSVCDVLEIAFGGLGLDWREFTTYDALSGSMRETLVGDPSRLERATGWSRHVSFAAMIEEMVAADLAALAASPPTSSDAAQ